MISAISHSNHRPSRRGFTLVEILVVVGIIVVLVGILLPTLIHAYSQADKTKTAADLQTISVALEAYKGDFGDYPRIDRNLNGNSGQDTGAALLCKSLIGPGPATVDATAAYTSASAGTLAAVGGVTYIWTSSTAAAAAPPSAGWVAWSPLDGADGPGFKIRAGMGKTYGPYLQVDRLKVNGGMIVDANSQPILYYPTAIIKPDVTAVASLTNGGYCAAYHPGPPVWPSPYVCATDNLSLLSLTNLCGLLGDIGADGKIDPVDTGTTKAETALASGYPFILIAAGSDAVFGPSTTLAKATSTTTWQTNKVNEATCDDITNFPRQ